VRARPQAFLLVLGTVLLVQGTLSLVLDATGLDGDRLPQRLANSDPGHAAIHLAWGLLLVVLVRRGLPGADAVRLCLLFGVFYSALAVAGLAVHHPLGLRLDRGENVFHLLVGPAALAVGLAAGRMRARPA
jgi:hypothetical protein